MKRITEYRKLLEVSADVTLKELSTHYKGLMKKHHPDRFQDETLKKEAEETSQRLIEAYKFLESIHPETHVKQHEDMTKTMASMIANWEFKAQVLTLYFGDGSAYEFFGVPAKLYNKFITTDGTARFVRRNILGTYPHRRVSGATAKE
jgi:DnaJ-class molecular chaperone